MDVRKIATRNAKPDRFGAGGEEQRAVALRGAVGGDLKGAFDARPTVRS